MLIQVLGPGCAKCKETDALVRTAAQAAGCPATVEKVTDFQAMLALGVLSTPAVVMDGTLMCAGRVPSRAEVESWLDAAGADRFRPA